ncbi:MAG: Glutathione transport system permease protein GsiD [Paracidovorax wautersii]|uniref:Glutathione transport system permease protein GsiD n=1 Tax=Paracidovorax wautersii TaxID=1177982 RepID=A0A7V8FRW5_9BURK|nr:MAG: Glutathione transport system permease protein GsiD [Paracidovorax wautersii]
MPALPDVPRVRRSAARPRIGLAVAALAFGLVVVAALLAPWVAPVDPNAIALGDSLAAPSAAHLFGADQLGRDVLSRAIHGARVSLLIAAATVLLAGGLGGALGLVAGFAGGRIDAVVMRLADMQLAFPAVILAMALAGAVGIDTGLLVVVLASANWARFARVVRSEALSLKTREFVLLARLAGASPAWIAWRHVAPHLAGTFVVLATLDVGSVIVLEATLSFLGLGVQPPAPSWGAMIAEGRGFLETAWWISVMPGLLLVVTVLSANTLGDALRDWLNPSLPE